MVTTAQRQILVKWAQVLAAHKDQVDYVAQRPMHNEHDRMRNVVRRFNRGIHIDMDCSEAVSMLFFNAGLKDPSGLGYDNYGNSGTMWRHLTRHYGNPNNAHPGALGVYGEAGSEHVVMVTKHDLHNPEVFSNGSQGGPYILPLSHESAAHAGQPFVFLDISSLGTRLAPIHRARRALATR